MFVRHSVTRLANTHYWVRSGPVDMIIRCSASPSQHRTLRSPMSAYSNEQIATKWFAAFNAHDLEALLSLYHDQAEHYSPKLKVRMPETNGMVRGKVEMRAWWRDAFDRSPTLHYVVLKLMANEEQVFMEYIRHASGEEDLRVGEVLVIENGSIVRSRVYHS